MSGQNELFEKHQTSIELIKTLELIRMWMGAKSITVIDWSDAYRQVAIAEKDFRFHCYEDFGFLFIDTRLPFGRADSARIFQKIANLMVRAIRRKWPELFTIPKDKIREIKEFTRLEPNERDQ